MALPVGYKNKKPPLSTRLHFNKYLLFQKPIIKSGNTSSTTNYCFPWLYFSSAAWAFLKSSTTPLMQYRKPVGGGPSSNTCPKCEWQRPHSTSVRCMPKE